MCDQCKAVCPFLDRSCLLLQVLFSSSVMYGNFVTIAQRRALAKEAQEHKDRYFSHLVSSTALTE